ncbi:MAG: hypothetical protein IT384_16765 [Deltaproteobacteria bacterium]|nr:hypothetical protein [Deltaproteobacteria bacterium]
MEGDILFGRPSRLKHLLRELPAADSYNHLFEHFFLSSMFALPESAGFSDPDGELLSIDGSSPFWTAWSLDDLQLGDPFFDGAAAFKVPLRVLAELELRHAESPRSPGRGGPRLRLPRGGEGARRFAVASISASGVGGVFPLGYALTRAFSSTHPADRSPPPPEDRRRLRERVRLQLADTERLFGRHTLRYAIELDRGARHYLSFPSLDVSRVGSFDETFTRLTGLAELTPSEQAYHLVLLGEYRDRSHLFAERYWAEDETLSLGSGGVMLGLVASGLRAAATYKHYALGAHDGELTRELIDLDGEGLFPIQPAGSMNALRFEAGLRFGALYASGDLRGLLWSPSAGAATQALTYQGAPYGQIDVASRAAGSWIGDHRLGLLGVEIAGPLELAYDAYLTAMHAHGDGTEALAFFDIGLETELRLPLGPAFTPFLILAKTPVSITSQVALTLNHDYLSTVERLVDGRTVETRGGRFVRADSSLFGTNTYAAAVGFESALGRGWRLAVQGLVKAFDHTQRLVLDGAPSRFGYQRDGIFYFSGGETRYVLENTPASEMPFYVAASIQAQNVEPGRSFVVAGFSMSSAVGHSPPLNGAFGNDVGIIDFSSANPNASIHGRANLDLDRAFVTRIAAGYCFFDALWASISLAHRDGQPFAYYDLHQDRGQVARTLSTTRGSPLRYTRPLSGPREDFQINVDAQLAYTLPLDALWSLRFALVGANLLDLGNELAEISLPGGNGERAALETQLPRSLYFAIELAESASPGQAPAH